MRNPHEGEIGVGIIGLGFMGSTHARAYQCAAAAGHACRLVAVTDASADARAGLSANRGAGPIDALAGHPFERAHVCVSVDELLGDPSIHLVSICTYTESHVPLAMRALDAGKHVLLEKPVALRTVDVERLAERAVRASTICMPAMCMRFWPGWTWIRDRVRDGRFGRVLSANFQRLGGRPKWAASFYGDIARSGGALFDLHIHDVDFIVHCFGVPDRVHSAGTIEHLTTQYGFANGPALVHAEGGWALPPDAPFRMRCTVRFEGGVADFDLARPEPLMIWTDNCAEAIALEQISGYDGEVRHLLAAIRSGRRELDAPLDDAMAVTCVLEAEVRSLQEHRTVDVEQCSPRTAHAR